MPQVSAALVMSHAHWVYGTFICFGGLLIAESQSAAARVSPADATLVASIAQVGRVIGTVGTQAEAGAAGRRNG